MSIPVTLHVRTEPYEERNHRGNITFDGNKIIGEVKRGEEILHTETVITNDSVTSVCENQDDIEIQIEIWAVENTDFMPTADALPS